MIASGIWVLLGLLYKFGQPHFTNIIAFRWTFCWLPSELCNKYSFHCSKIFDLISFFYSDDTAFSSTAILAPLVAKLLDSSTTFSKVNLMTST